MATNLSIFGRSLIYRISVFYTGLLIEIWLFYAIQIVRFLWATLYIGYIILKVTAPQKIEKHFSFLNQPGHADFWQKIVLKFFNRYIFENQITCVQHSCDQKIFMFKKSIYLMSRLNLNSKFQQFSLIVVIVAIERLLKLDNFLARLF